MLELHLCMSKRGGAWLEKQPGKFTTKVVTIMILTYKKLNILRNIMLYNYNKDNIFVKNF